jgi:hypothetical protein
MAAKRIHVPEESNMNPPDLLRITTKNWDDMQCGMPCYITVFDIDYGNGYAFNAPIAVANAVANRLHRAVFLRADNTNVGQHGIYTGVWEIDPVPVMRIWLSRVERDGVTADITEARTS